MQNTVSPDPRAPFDFEAHSRVATDQYQKLRPLYEAFSYIIEDMLKEALSNLEIKVASIEARAKTIESFGRKCSEHSDENPEQPKYTMALVQITDLAGARIITFFPNTVVDVEKFINDQFLVLERIDKTDLLKAEGRFGYKSIHYLVRLNQNRTALPEYRRFAELIVEIQVRTILQHAWAEIEHDIQYWPVKTIPSSIRRKFMQMAVVLEIVDRTFQEIHDEDEGLRQKAGVSVLGGN